MHDLALESAWTCQTNEYWETSVKGSKGDIYRVAFEHLLLDEAMRQDVEYGWTCTCKGFKFRGSCKHVKQAKVSGRRCGWNAHLEPTLDCGTDDDGNPCCPECGGAVSAYQVAV